MNDNYFAENKYVIEADNVSNAWAKVFLSLMNKGIKSISPLVVKINFDDNNKEILEVKNLIDEFLLTEEKNSIQTVSNTIFPNSLWLPHKNKEKLFQNYREIWTKIKEHHVQSHYPNKLGTYFSRMLCFNDYKDLTNGHNQLKHIFACWEKAKKSKRYRASALVCSIFDPRTDHNFSPRHLFPCVQQVGVILHGSMGDAGIEFYALLPKQLIIDRGYGNYLGLLNLGQFIAYEMNLEFKQLNCFISNVELGYKKNVLRGIESSIKEILS